LAFLTEMMRCPSSVAVQTTVIMRLEAQIAPRSIVGQTTDSGAAEIPLLFRCSANFFPCLPI
jgi:hypothetical protein